MKVNINHLVLFAILILLTTVLRASLLLFAPILILMISIHFGFTFRRHFINLCYTIIICLLLSFTNGFYIKYNLLSLYYIIPFLLLLFSKPKYYLSSINLFLVFINATTALMIINNVIGIFQYFHFPNDDSFAGLYGHFTVTQNGLSIINALLFYYYLRRFIYNKRIFSFVLFLFFSVCFIMGFYGGGILAVTAALLLQSFRLSFKKIFIALFAGAAIITIIGLIIYAIRPDTLRYNLNIISRFTGKEGEPTPRKLLSYKNYLEGYSSNLKDMTFGSGPGTFNSRSAFMIGGPDYFKMPGVFKSVNHQPYYFKNYAYTLWNKSNTGKWQDGFMNQPFSSLLTFLGEYGLIFTLLLIFYYFSQHRTVISYHVFSNQDKLAKDTYSFASYLLVFLLIIDNYAEYPEITILILLLMKLAEMELIKSGNKNNIENA